MPVFSLPLSLAIAAGAAVFAGVIAALLGEKYVHPARRSFAVNVRLSGILGGAAFIIFGLLAVFNPAVLLLAIPVVIVLLTVMYTDLSRLHVHRAVYLLIPYGFLLQYLLHNSSKFVITSSVFGLAFAAVLYLGIYFGFPDKMGFGDVAAALAAGATLGVELLAIVSAAAAVAGIVCLLIRKRVLRIDKPRMPFAALLSGAWMIAFIFLR